MGRRWKVTKVDIGLSILCACIEAAGLLLVLRWALHRSDSLGEGWLHR